MPQKKPFNSASNNLLPPAAKTPFEKGVLDSPKLFIGGVLLLCLWLLPSYLWGQEGDIVQPLKHEKRFYLDTGGKLYTPLDMPIFMHISATPAGKEPFRLAVRDGLSDRRPIKLKEGVNLLGRIGPGAEYRVYADGTPPVTRTVLTNAPKYVKDGGVFFGQGLVLAIDAHDNLSGVQASYFSREGKPFQPHLMPFPRFKPGKYHISVYSVDNVGNVEPVTQTTFYVDPDPPHTKLEIKGHFKDNILSPHSIISLAAEDDLSGVATLFYRIDEGKTQAYNKEFKPGPLADGEHSLHYFARDHVENNEPTHSFKFIYDSRPPRLVFSTEGGTHTGSDTLFVSPQTKVKIEAFDEPAGPAAITLRIGGGPETTYNAPFPLPRQSGIHKVRYNAVDHAGNPGKQQLEEVYLDQDPPKTLHLLSGSYFKRGKAYVIRKETRIHLAATDWESGVQSVKYRIGESEEKTYNPAKPLSFSEDGTYTLAYYALDRVNNKETQKTLSLVVDSTTASAPPTPPSHHPKQWFQSKDGTVTGPARHPFYLVISTGPGDQKTSFVLDLDRLKEENGKPPLFEKAGLNYLRLTAGKKSQLYTVNIDNLPPVGSHVFKEAQLYRRGKTLFFGPGLVMDFKARDPAQGASSGFAKTMVSIDGGPFIAVDKPLRLFSREKNYLCRYYFVDHTGNTPPPRRAEFTVDTTPPTTIARLRATAYGRVLSQYSSITLEANDNLCGVKAIYYRFDNRKERIYYTPLTGEHLARLGNGAHRLVYYAADHLGNTEEPQEIPFILDNRPPKVSLQVLGDHAQSGDRLYVSARTRVRLSAQRKPAGVKTIRCRIDDSPFRDYRAPFLVPPPNPDAPDRGKTITYFSIDKTGNSSPEYVKTLFPDSSPPRSGLSLDGPRFTANGTVTVNPATKIRLETSDHESGPENIYYAVDGGFKIYKEPFPITKDGLHTITYYAADRVNNREEKQTYTVYVDALPPEIRIMPAKGIKDKNRLWTLPGDVLIFIHAKDKSTEVDRVTYSLDGAPERLYRGPLADFRPGLIHTLKAFALDRLNNRGEAVLRFRIAPAPAKK
jgi:hypothetical protein